jgi:hypothetical protein
MNNSGSSKACFEKHATGNNCTTCTIRIGVLHEHAGTGIYGNTGTSQPLNTEVCMIYWFMGKICLVHTSLGELVALVVGF